MSERELLEYYKNQRIMVQYYLKRYIEELKLHFSINDFHIVEILEKEVKSLKNKTGYSKWLKFFKQI